MHEVIISYKKGDSVQVWITSLLFCYVVAMPVGGLFSYIFWFSFSLFLHAARASCTASSRAAVLFQQPVIPQWVRIGSTSQLHTVLVVSRARVFALRSALGFLCSGYFSDLDIEAVNRRGLVAAAQLLSHDIVLAILVSSQSISASSRLGLPQACLSAVLFWGAPCTMLLVPLRSHVKNTDWSSVFSAACGLHTM